MRKNFTKQAPTRFGNKAINTLKCRFHHPMFCQKLGNTSCRNKDCYMHLVEKEDRDIAAKIILDEMVNRELHVIRERCKNNSTEYDRKNPDSKQYTRST